MKVPGPPPKLGPLSPQRFALQVTIDRSTHDKLRRAQELLSHQILNSDLAKVLDRVLDLAIERLEKKKLRANPSRPRSNKASKCPRYIPQSIKDAVWKRDGGRCTFVSRDGRRCSAADYLEFDHIISVALGGESTKDNVRLRCRAHNQYEAELAFGIGFMRRKREEARQAARGRKERRERADEVIPWLRALRFSAEDARRAAEQ